MKSDEIIIIGLAGLTALILLSKKAEGIPIPQPPVPKYDCSNFDTM